MASAVNIFEVVHVCVGARVYTHVCVAVVLMSTR